ncbi:unnamed protein product [Soboliphyme baturini]|uniref:Transcriptional regulator n=1 Tax=Soboliphyme baturini TaxID=241478 RepID=A0A183IVD3_9BILA|nr:unnamed protein product [Soboliphyme baturini]
MSGGRKPRHHRHSREAVIAVIADVQLMNEQKAGRSMGMSARARRMGGVEGRVDRNRESALRQAFDGSLGGRQLPPAHPPHFNASQRPSA